MKTGNGAVKIIQGARILNQRAGKTSQGAVEENHYHASMPGSNENKPRALNPACGSANKPGRNKNKSRSSKN
jgi:hypothetical protein